MKLFLLMVLTASFGFANSLVEVTSSADTSFYDSSKAIGLIRLDIKAWNACKNEGYFGTPQSLAKNCEVLGNISGYDATCEGTYQCFEGEKIERLFIEVAEKDYASSKDYAKKVTQVRAEKKVQEKCKAVGKNGVFNTLYAYWEIWQDFYYAWHAEYFGIFECKV